MATLNFRQINGLSRGPSPTVHAIINFDLVQAQPNKHSFQHQIRDIHSYPFSSLYNFCVIKLVSLAFFWGFLTTFVGGENVKIHDLPPFRAIKIRARHLLLFMVLENSLVITKCEMVQQENVQKMLFVGKNPENWMSTHCRVLVFRLQPFSFVRYPILVCTGKPILERQVWAHQSVCCGKSTECWNIF